MKPHYNSHQGCIAFLVILFLCISCAPREFLSRTPPKSSYSIKLAFDPIVPEALRQSITEEFAFFTTASAARPVRFISVEDSWEADMVISVKTFEPVTSGRSALGVFVTLVGMTAPILMASAGAPIVVFFWYFPKSESIAEIQFKADDGNAFSMHRILGPGFLKKEGTQLKQHHRGYKAFFIRMQRHYEKDLRRLK
jgi:hypothetical protein